MDINKYIKEAMLAKDSIRLSTLRAIKSAFLLAETQKGATALDELAKQKIIQKLLKQRKEAAEIYQQQNRSDLASDELAQADILQSFLPKQLSQDEIKEIVSKTIGQIGASSMADMGKVMSLVNKKLAGKADGKIIAQIVKSRLT
ncbi:MAG: GatB/YqeY domain-containing protein [Bacteroidota bacterium]|nr:GatB/YqeY domain-containing protein [Bacteroidota bacterium]